MLQADVRTINNGILDDLSSRHPQAQLSGLGGFVREGILYVPNRGPLQLYPGDIVARDPATGGVILVTARAAAGASWVHS